MKSYQPADIRNFAIVGHATSGKTMLAEAMLMCGDVIHRMGGIVQGSTVSDYHVGEQQRQISIHATPLSLEWQGRRLNVIDTPGYLDFSSEALNALRVVDFAIVVIHASHGIGVGTEMMWDYATQFGIPKIIVINALDKENVDYDLLVEEIRERFGTQVFPMQVPVNPGPGFNQVLDVLRSEVCTYAADRSGKYTGGAGSGRMEGARRGPAQGAHRAHRGVRRHPAGEVFRRGQPVRGGHAHRHPSRRAEAGVHPAVLHRRRRPTSAWRGCSISSRASARRPSTAPPSPRLTRRTSPARSA